MANYKKHKLIKAELRKLLPGAPLSEFVIMEEIGARGHLRHLPPPVIAKQAATTHIRHNHTDYDQYLADGFDVDSARYFVLDDMQEIIRGWGGTYEVGYLETK